MHNENQFIQQFGEAIKGFWDTGSEERKQCLLTDILHYAKTHPEKFKKELQEVQFDKEFSPLPVVLEALSKDTDTWGHFFVDTLDKIFEHAKASDKPHDILNYLIEFAYIEQDHRPFVQTIVDRLNKETDSGNLSSKLAAIWTLPAYLKNSSIKNKSSILRSLQDNLLDKNWKVRYVTHKALGYEDMLPVGQNLSLSDRMRKLIFGEPKTV